MILNQLKTIALLGVLSAMLVGIGGALGPSFLWLFAIVAVAMNLGAYFFSDKLVLRMSGAREVSPAEAPALHRMVDELARAAELPKPRVYVTPEAQPNAFATGRNPANGVVAVTQGLMQVLTERELRGVLAHELAHIKNRDILVSSVAAMFATAVSSIANAIGYAAMFGGSSSDEDEGGGSMAGGLLLSFLAPIAASLVQFGISRSREYMADETGARISGDPEALASALEKLQLSAQRIPAHPAPATASMYIVNPFSAFGSRMLSLFSTHPPMEERVRRLRQLAGASHGERPAYRAF